MADHNQTVTAYVQLEKKNYFFSLNFVRFLFLMKSTLNKNNR